jgi:hypothetical protein
MIMPINFLQELLQDAQEKKQVERINLIENYIEDMKRRNENVFNG